jgi:hypothetical protein
MSSGMPSPSLTESVNSRTSPQGVHNPSTSLFLKKIQMKNVTQEITQTIIYDYFITIRPSFRFFIPGKHFETKAW